MIIALMMDKDRIWDINKKIKYNGIWYKIMLRTTIFFCFDLGLQHQEIIVTL